MRNVPPRSVLAITAVFAVALVVRLAWAWWTAPAPPEFSDAQYYDASARGLANGDGYRVAFGETGFDNGGAATAFWPPGYPMYLAAGYAAFGDDLIVARTANAVAGALVIVPVYFIARRLFGEAAGLAAAGIAALLPSYVF